MERGGQADVGGIAWLDWQKFFPIKGWNQLVGHSEGADIRGKHLIVKEGKLVESTEVCSKEKSVSKNYCADTYNRHVAAIENGKVRVEVPEL